MKMIAVIICLFFLAAAKSQSLTGLQTLDSLHPVHPQIIKDSLPVIISDSCERNTYYVRYALPYVYVYTQRKIDGFVPEFEHAFGQGGKEFQYFLPEKCMVFRIADHISFELEDIKTMLSYFICN